MLIEAMINLYIESKSAGLLPLRRCPATGAVPPTRAMPEAYFGGLLSLKSLIICLRSRAVYAARTTKK